jgi:ligand-binding sensor domain-containing protein/signal transduction histidine kinase
MNACVKQFETKRRWLRRFCVAGVVSVQFLLLAPAFALDPSRSVFQYNCRTWFRQNGLPANTVNAIAQTKDGYIWLGTSAGLVRFDGGEFKLYDASQLPKARSTIVTSLSKSPHDGFWFGMERGAFGYFDGKNMSLLGREEWAGMNLDVHSVLETKEGDLWIAAEVLAGRVVSNTFEAVLNSSATARYDVSALYQDSKGRVWLGTARQGLYYWQKGILTKFPDPVFDQLTIHCLVEDGQGQIWVGTDMGLICYDSNLQRKPFTFPWFATRALLVDKANTLWIGTSGGGLVRYLDGGFPIELHQKDGLADDFVTSLAEDEEGSIWVGTRNGLSQVSDVKIPTFGKAEGLTANVNVAVSGSSAGSLWVATSEGFTYFDGTAHPQTNLVGLSNAYVTGVFEAKNGDLYLIDGSMSVSVFSGGKVVASYPNKSWPVAMVEDDRSVIVSVGGDLFRVGTNFYEPYAFKNNQKPPLNWIFKMAMSGDGSIWIGADEGICRVRNDTFEMWTTAQGLGKSKVRWICEDSDRVVWAGLETGIARLKDGKIRNVGREQGLFDNFIYAIVPDDHGNLWVDSSRGYFQVSRKSLNDFCDGKTERVECIGYDGPDAVKSSEKYQQHPSGCKTLDGRIWFPTAQGIVMIDPTKMTANPVPPKIHIQSVRANGRELFEGSGTAVRPGSGELEFHYAGISYLAPLKIQYRYKLDGYDKDWVEVGSRRSAFYTNLKPGDYSFHVQARNVDGAWNSADDSFAVALPGYMYQTVWFRGLVGISVIAALIGIYRRRDSQRRWKQEQLLQARDLLEAEVASRTSELATANASLQYEEIQLKQRTQALEKEIEERERMQLEIERVHRELLETSRQAGMAEVATNVLHNVGNVLNSVNVSAALVADNVKHSKVPYLEKVSMLLEENSADLGAFMTTDPRGIKLPGFLSQLSGQLAAEQQNAIRELELLRQNVEHIKVIVAMQQDYAKISGVTETVNIIDLVEDALRMNAGALARHVVKLVREYADVLPVTVEKHKVLQILVNLIRNAKHACDDSGRDDKQLTIKISPSEAGVQIAVIDNGVGIPAENLTRIFNHGFTTRKNGHGFGLHSGALAAKELGGALTVHSDGHGTGATFILELSLQPPKKDL